MRVSYCSDLHLEFGELPLDLVDNKEQAFALVLAGDILVADAFNPDVSSSRQKQRDRYMTFLNHVCSKYANVLMVCGNHEHYKGYLGRNHQLIRDATSELTNFHLMENTVLHLGELSVFGATFWTDLHGADPMVMYQCQHRMNDYSMIREGEEGLDLLQPSTVVDMNRETVSQLKSFLDSADSPVLVVSHHAPSLQSRGGHSSGNLDYAYCNSLDDLIIDNPKINAWIHGHTHKSEDYMIGQTRVLSNPRGYIGYEGIAENFQLRSVDL